MSLRGLWRVNSPGGALITKHTGGGGGDSKV